MGLGNGPLLIRIVVQPLHQIPAEDNVEAVVALHNTADLTGGQGAGSVLKLGDHGAGGVDVAGGVALTAGILAVSIRQLGKQLFHILRFLELGEEILCGGTLGGNLILGQRGAGGGILGGEENVVSIGSILVIILRGQVQGASLLQHQVGKTIHQIGSHGQPLKALLPEAQLCKIVLEGLLASQLLHGGGTVGGHGLLILLRHLHAVFLGHVFQGGIEFNGILHLLQGKLIDSLAFGKLPIPDQGAILPYQVAVSAVVGVGVENLIVDEAAIVGSPVEIELGGDSVAIHLHHCFVGGDAGNIIEDTGRGLLALAAGGKGQDHSQRQQGADCFFHVQAPYRFGYFSARISGPGPLNSPAGRLWRYKTPQPHILSWLAGGCNLIFPLLVPRRPGTDPPPG